MWIGFICVKTGSSCKERLNFDFQEDKYILEESGGTCSGVDEETILLGCYAV
jgi:hypothetical protein